MNTARMLALVLGLAVAAAQAADPNAASAGSAASAANPATSASGAASAAASAAADVNPAVDTSPAPEAGPAVNTSPAVNTNAAASATATHDNGSTRTAQGAATSAADSIQLGTTEISGNRELPKLLYIVPWQRAQVGKFSGRPPNSLVEEALTPVDRSVFERQNRYYAALESSTQSAVLQPPTSQPGTAPTAAAAGSPRDEK